MYKIPAKELNTQKKENEILRLEEIISTRIKALERTLEQDTNKIESFSASAELLLETQKSVEKKLKFFGELLVKIEDHCGAQKLLIQDQNLSRFYSSFASEISNFDFYKLDAEAIY